MISFLKKLRNWLVLGKFISIYIVTCKCNNTIKVFTLESGNEQEAIKKAYEEGGKMNCKSFEIVEIVEH